MMEPDPDLVLAECDLEGLSAFVEELESRHEVALLRNPAVCLTMVRAADSLEGQEFYLGEALTTDCEVLVDGQPGYGLCLGDEPQRTYCMAVIDAIRHSEAESLPSVTEFLGEQGRRLQEAEKEEFDRILSTRVDFKLMEDN